MTGHYQGGEDSRRAMKYILNDYSMDYKSRQESLSILPLMYIFEIYDIF